MPLTVINDLHVGAVRTGGTTPASAMALRQYLIDGLEQLLSSAKGDLMILGDLFDTQAISLSDLLKAYSLLIDWLAESPGKMYLVAGNHDLSKNSTALSSFQFLCRLLYGAYPGQVVPIFQPGMTPYGYVIPHLPNQDIFNQELASVPPCKVLFLHCNYNNEFAQESDHSLNLSKEQAEAVPVERIVIAHEHNARRMLGNKVWLPGNQLASSVSDCMEQKVKHITVVQEDGAVAFEDWQAPDYAEVDWRVLAGAKRDFVRVVGEAESHEASDVVTAISRYRQTSEAFVVTNAVHIAGDEQTEAFATSLEQVKSFDVMAALKEHLTPAEWAIVESLK